MRTMIPERASIQGWTIVVVLLSAIAYAGCIGSDDEPPPRDAVSNDGETTADLALASGGLGSQETNRTVEGTGGQPHIHDYWNGRSVITLFEGTVRSNTFPIFVDRTDPVNGGMWQMYFELPQGALVYEGTGRLEVSVSETNPVPVTLSLSYKTPLNDDWSDPVAVDPPTATEIEVTPRTADSPHSSRSHWAFRLTMTTAPKILPPTVSADVRIDAVRSRNIEMWPGHPEFYAESPARVILDTEVTTEAGSVTEILFFGASPGGIRPEYLISMGTTRVEVHVNVTNYEGMAGTEPGQYYLIYRHPNLTRNHGGIYAYDRNQDGSGYAHFSNISVGHDQHDPPYADMSRWQFRVETAVSGVCNNCSPYSLTYHLTVVAWNDEKLAHREKTHTR